MALVGSAGMVILAYAIVQMGFKGAVFTGESFSNSDILRERLRDVSTQVESALFYKSPTYVEMGSALDQSELAEQRANLSLEMAQEIDELKNRYDDWLEQAKSREDTHEVERLNLDQSKQIQDIELRYKVKKDNVENDMITSQRVTYRTLLKTLENSDAYFYVSINDYLVMTNLGKQNSTNPNDAPFVKTIADAGFNDKASLEAFMMAQKGHDQFSESSGEIHIALKPEAYTALEKEFNERYAIGRYWIQACAIGFTLFLLAWIYLLYAAGRKVDDEGEIHLNALDRIYLDVGLVITVSVITVCIAALGALGYIQENNEVIYPASLLVVIGTLMGYVYTMSFVKRFKRHEVLKHTFVACIFRWIGRSWHNMMTNIQSLFFGKVTMRRVVISMTLYALGAFAIIVLSFGLASGGIAGLFVGIILLGVYHLWILKGIKVYVEGFEKILEGTEIISNGSLDYRIELEPMGDLSRLAEQVNNITVGLGKAVESEVKAERLKSELISNVSHDLRTPLTVIRTYIDLLKTEGIQSEEAPKYLEVLDEKSQRLQKLTEDLFDAAKASTGNIPVRLERVNLTALVLQGMGELSEGMNASGLQFVTNMPESETWVMADGGLLWRVIENLFNNVFKYALPGSRVYVEVNQSVEVGMCCFTMKNTSSEALNIPADELLQRFKRGDAARTTEGSGLGLSIAKSLTENQGGRFTLTVDGDLFKVEVCLKNA